MRKRRYASAMATGSLIHPSARVHPTADLEPEVEIGAGTSVWHRAQIRQAARLGASCIVGRDVFIDERVVIGDRVKLQNGALVYHGVTVEDGVFIGPGAILTNDRSPRAITTSGDLTGPGDWTVSPITLRTGCSIGAGAIVVAGVEVGAYAMVGAGAVVSKDVLDHALVVGNPARRIGWVCDCGARLVDRHANPAPEDPRPATELTCSTCAKDFTYVSDLEGIRERTREKSAAGGGPRA